MIRLWDYVFDIEAEKEGRIENARFNEHSPKGVSSLRSVFAKKESFDDFTSKETGDHANWA